MEPSFLNTFFSVVTDLGNSAITSTLTLVYAVALLISRQSRAAKTVLVAYASTAALLALAKVLLGSGCALILNIPSLHSPSGHTALSLLTYGMLAINLSRTCSGWGRYASLAAGGILVGLIAYSRVALDYHTPFEVLVGAAIGGAALFLIWGRLAMHPANARAMRWFLPMAAGVLIVLYGFRLPAEDALNHVSRVMRIFTHLC